MHNVSSNFQNLNLDNLFLAFVQQENFCLEKLIFVFTSSFVCKPAFAVTLAFIKQHRFLKLRNTTYWIVFPYFFFCGDFIGKVLIIFPFSAPVCAYFGGWWSRLRSAHALRAALVVLKQKTRRCQGNAHAGRIVLRLQTIEPASRTVIHTSHCRKQQLSDACDVTIQKESKIRTEIRETLRQRSLYTGKRAFNRFCISRGLGQS